MPFARVNDGVCDHDLCCDGSDEWEGVGGTRCEDRCKEIGKEWRKAEEVRQKSLGTASKRRKELVIEAGRLRKEVEARIQTLKTQVESDEVKVDGLRKELAEVERRERGRVVKAQAKGGKTAVLAGLAKARIEELAVVLGKVRRQRDSDRDRLVELEELLANLKDGYDPNYNDEAVKRAVRGWENYAAQEDAEEDAGLDQDVDAILKADSETDIKWEEWEEQAENEVAIRKFDRPPSDRWTISG